MSTRWRLAVLVVAPMVLGQPSSLIAPAAPMSVEAARTIADEVDVATDEEAVRFRRTFGFAADLEFVRAARLSPVDFSSEPYGVPLSKSEISELQRRADVQQSMGGVILHARSADTFAGAYIDQLDGGKPVFLFTADGPTLREDIAAQFPAATDFRIERVARTETELLGLKTRIEADLGALAKQGIDIVRIAFRPSLNTVLVGVHGLTAGVESTLELRYGPEIIAFEDDVAHSDVCDATNNCRPIKGGISINHTGGSAGECTSGFVVRRGDTNALALVTAGHCIETKGGLNQAWQHNGVGFGRALRETWIPGGTGDADVGLITIQSSEWPSMTNKNQIRRTNGSVTNVVAIAMPIENGQACRVGKTSGHDCGVIRDPAVGRASAVSGYPEMWVTQTATVNFDSQGGDSGGPVFYYVNGGTTGSVVALGTHVHSEDPPNADEGWFSPQFWGSWNYTALWGYTYSICTTAAC